MFSKFFGSLWSNGDAESHRNKRKRQLEGFEEEESPRIKRSKPQRVENGDQSHYTKVASWVNIRKRSFCDNYYVRKVVHSPKYIMDKLTKLSQGQDGSGGNHSNPRDHLRRADTHNVQPSPRHNYPPPPPRMDRNHGNPDVHYGADIMSSMTGMQVHSTPLPVNTPPPAGYNFTESNFDLNRPDMFSFQGSPIEDYRFQAPTGLPPRFKGDNTFVPVNKLSRPPLRPGADETMLAYRSSAPSHNSNTSMYEKTFSQPRRRVAPAQQSRARMASRETIRLDERNRYAELLQQFTLAPLPGTAFGATHIRKQTGSGIFSNVSRSETALGTPVSNITAGKPVHRANDPDRRRVAVSPSKSLPGRPITALPERLESVLPGATGVTIDLTGAGSSDGSRATSRKVSLSDSVEVIEIGSSAESRSRRNKYSSNARKAQKQVQELEIENQHHKQKREEWDKDLERRIRQRLRLSEREKGVTEEIFTDEEEDDIVDEFPELTEEQAAMVERAFVRYPQEQVLTEGFKLQLTRQDIQTLNGLQWLNDEVINFYMNMLVDRGSQEGRPKVHAFNTFFYPKVMSGGQQSVRRWTKKVDIFSMDYILVPVHLGMHWCLAVIDFRKKEIRYYDSMGGNNMSCLAALKKYLQDESMDKRKEKFDTSDWKLVNMDENEIPQQMNGSDCGMFACKFAEYITRDARINFSQEHMPYFRRRMVYEMLCRKLL